jgi:hypothetical protein
VPASLPLERGAWSVGAFTLIELLVVIANIASHMQAMRPTDLRVRNLREPGSLPGELDYPGE